LKEKLTIVKVGGAIVENHDSLQKLLDHFQQIDGAKILVHGGGRSATALAAQMGIETKMVNGRRVTDAEMLRIVTMVYGGLVNKNIVAQLQARSINALGLTGADAGVILSHRRPVVTTADGQSVDYGFVGDVYSTNGRVLANLIESGITPVMAPLTHDGQGTLLNTNADTIAAETAKGMADMFDVSLMYCFEHNGVLMDADDESSVIPHINAKSFQTLVAEGVIQGGMIPKIENALDACRNGVGCVVITNADNISNTESGTVITL